MNDMENCLRQRADCDSDRRRQLQLATQAEHTGWYAYVTALSGIIVILVASMLCDWTPDRQLAPTVLVLSGCGVLVLPIGMISSWISRKYFVDTAFPAHVMAILISMIGVVSIFGWGLVVAARH